MPQDDLREQKDPPRRFERFDAAEFFRSIGVDVTDTESRREFSADLYYLRRQRVTHQSRISMTWTALLSAAISALVGALGVLLSNLMHLWK